LGPRGKPVKVVEKASAEETRLSLGVKTSVFLK